MRGMRGERLSVREEGSGGGSELRSRFRSGSGSVENILDPDPEKTIRLLRIRMRNTACEYANICKLVLHNRITFLFN